MTHFFLMRQSLWVDGFGLDGLPCVERREHEQRPLAACPGCRGTEHFRSRRLITGFRRIHNDNWGEIMIFFHVGRLGIFSRNCPFKPCILRKVLHEVCLATVAISIVMIQVSFRRKPDVRVFLVRAPFIFNFWFNCPSCFEENQILRENTLVGSNFFHLIQVPWSTIRCEDDDCVVVLARRLQCCDYFADCGI
jgi:hypothetical protein